MRLNFDRLILVSCLLCRGATPLRQPVCRLCIAQCPVADQGCALCGVPLLTASTDICASCLKKAPPFDRCLPAFIYNYPVNHIIQRIKYSRQISLLPVFSCTLVEVLRHNYSGLEWPEVIIPVPLHKRRLRHRGYDQALLLGKEVQKKLRKVQPIKLDYKLVRRSRNTPAQQELPAKERRKNIRDAFSLTTTFDYRHAAIVDDVVTTGETVGEITRLLKRHGAEKVDVWCLARTPP